MLVAGFEFGLLKFDDMSKKILLFKFDGMSREN